jgi:hypothetical protein
MIDSLCQVSNVNYQLEQTVCVIVDSVCQVSNVKYLVLVSGICVDVPQNQWLMSQSALPC